MSTAKNFARWVEWFLAIMLLISSVGIAVSAQTSSSGTITGVVKDEKGAVVPGATVTVTNLGTNSSRTAVTTSEGTYEISQLVPGDYRLEVQTQGFAKY